MDNENPPCSSKYLDQVEEVHEANGQWINQTQWINCNDTLVAAEYEILNSTELPAYLRFDENAKNDIIIYSVLFIIAAVGNLTVFITLFRSRYWKSRVNLMIMHLAAADLMVTFLLIPFEIGWRITTQWLAGNFACKVLLFLRAFCLYLSSMVLVCISLDRYFAILFPLKVNDAQRRGKLMLGFAWTTAATCSLPQSVIFHVDSHPEYPSFKQCVTFGFFMTTSHEMAYNLFCLAVMYFFPLFLTIVVYVRILWEIYQKSKESKDFFKSIEEQKREASSSKRSGGSRLRLRRSDMTSIERAKTKSLKMTIIIVLAFIWCWTPYAVMVMWYMFDRARAEQVDRRLQDVMFIMAVSNSCVNPLVYGTYNLNLKNELWRCLGRQTDQPLSRPSASTSFRGRGSIAYQAGVSSYHSPNAKVFEDKEYLRRDSNFSRRTQTSFYRGLLHEEGETSPPFHLRQGNSFISKRNTTDEVASGHSYKQADVEVQYIELPVIEIDSRYSETENLIKNKLQVKSSNTMANLNVSSVQAFNEGSNLIIENTNSSLGHLNTGLETILETKDNEIQ